MSDCIVHRGPDDSGVWTDGSAGMALSFRRLSIIDLSPLGHQPMVSASSRYVIVFNGEVYNYRALRDELRALGHTFRGGSDTEVLLAAFEQWDVTSAVSRFAGMFAIALWDSDRRELHLIRDRIGKKPLFVCSSPHRLIFASELKALFAAGLDSAEVDRDALNYYLRYLYVPAPLSILAGVRKLLPGHIATISAEEPGVVRDTVYWSLDGVAQRACKAQVRDDERAVVDEFLELLSDAVALRMYADVPLGALLSGGIDSSLVTAVMQSRATTPVNTFCIGFDAAQHDESAFARRVAEHLGTKHHELEVTGADALALVEQIPVILDEPLANPSAIPTFLVSKLAKQHVTVVLTGDGGDELFAGYNRHSAALAMQPFDRVPDFLRKGFADLLDACGDRTARFGDAVIGSLMRSPTRPRLDRGRISKIARAVRASDSVERYRLLLSAWADPADVLRVPGVNTPDPIVRAMSSIPDCELLRRVLLADQSSYLPDDLLAKVDRTSMAVSLEARTPLLDHRLVEFSWSLGSQFKLRGDESKWLLRKALERFMPPTLFERPKVGFTVPLAAWLLGPLRAMSLDLLNDAGEGSDSFFSASTLQRTWRRFERGRQTDLALPIWAVIQFQAWRRHWNV